MGTKRTYREDLSAFPLFAVLVGTGQTLLVRRCFGHLDTRHRCQRGVRGTVQSFGRDLGGVKIQGFCQLKILTGLFASSFNKILAKLSYFHGLPNFGVEKKRGISIGVQTDLSRLQLPKSVCRMNKTENSTTRRQQSHIHDYRVGSCIG